MENDLIVNVLSMGWVSLYIISALSAHIPYLADLVNKDGDLFLLRQFCHYAFLKVEHWNILGSGKYSK